MPEKEQWLTDILSKANTEHKDAIEEYNALRTLDPEAEGEGGYEEALGLGIRSMITDKPLLRAAQAIEWLSGGPGKDDSGFLSSIIKEQKQDIQEKRSQLRKGSSFTGPQAIFEGVSEAGSLLLPAAVTAAAPAVVSAAGLPSALAGTAGAGLLGAGAGLAQGYASGADDTMRFFRDQAKAAHPELTDKEWKSISDEMVNDARLAGLVEGGLGVFTDALLLGGGKALSPLLSPFKAIFTKTLGKTAGSKVAAGILKNAYEASAKTPARRMASTVAGRALGGGLMEAVTESAQEAMQTGIQQEGARALSAIPGDPTQSLIETDRSPSAAAGVGLFANYLDSFERVAGPAFIGGMLGGGGMATHAETMYAVGRDKMDQYLNGDIQLDNARDKADMANIAIAIAQREQNPFIAQNMKDKLVSDGALDPEHFRQSLKGANREGYGLVDLIDELDAMATTDPEGQVIAPRKQMMEGGLLDKWLSGEAAPGAEVQQETAAEFDAGVEAELAALKGEIGVQELAREPQMLQLPAPEVEQEVFDQEIPTAEGLPAPDVQERLPAPAPEVEPAEVIGEDLDNLIKRVTESNVDDATKTKLIESLTEAKTKTEPVVEVEPEQTVIGREIDNVIQKLSDAKVKDDVKNDVLQALMDAKAKAEPVIEVEPEEVAIGREIDSVIQKLSKTKVDAEVLKALKDAKAKTEPVIETDTVEETGTIGEIDNLIEKVIQSNIDEAARNELIKPLTEAKAKLKTEPVVEEEVVTEPVVEEEVVAEEVKPKKDRRRKKAVKPVVAEPAVEGKVKSRRRRKAEPAVPAAAIQVEAPVVPAKRGRKTKKIKVAEIRAKSLAPKIAMDQNPESIKAASDFINEIPEASMATFANKFESSDQLGSWFKNLDQHDKSRVSRALKSGDIETALKVSPVGETKARLSANKGVGVDPVTLTDSMKKLSDKIEVVATQKELGLDDKEGTYIKGMLDGTTGKIKLVAENLDSEADAAVTIMHELGHGSVFEALKAMDAKFAESFLNKVYDANGSDIRNLGSLYGYDMDSAIDKALATEEWLVRQVDEAQETRSPWYKRLLLAIKKLANKWFGVDLLSEADIETFIRENRARTLEMREELAAGNVDLILEGGDAFGDYRGPRFNLKPGKKKLKVDPNIFSGRVQPVAEADEDSNVRIDDVKKTIQDIAGKPIRTQKGMLASKARVEHREFYDDIVNAMPSSVPNLISGMFDAKVDDLGLEKDVQEELRHAFVQYMFDPKVSGELSLGEKTFQEVQYSDVLAPILERAKFDMPALGKLSSQLRNLANNIERSNIESLNAEPGKESRWWKMGILGRIISNAFEGYRPMVEALDAASKIQEKVFGKNKYNDLKYDFSYANKLRYLLTNFTYKAQVQAKNIYKYGIRSALDPRVKLGPSMEEVTNTIPKGTEAEVDKYMDRTNAYGGSQRVIEEGRWIHVGTVNEKAESAIDNLENIYVESKPKEDRDGAREKFREVSDNILFNNTDSDLTYDEYVDQLENSLKVDKKLEVKNVEGDAESFNEAVQESYNLLANDVAGVVISGAGAGIGLSDYAFALEQDEYFKAHPEVKQMDKTLEVLREYHNALLQLSVESGLLSKESYDYITKRHQQYIAFNRIMRDIEDGGAEGYAHYLNKAQGGLGTSKRLVKKFRGSQEMIQNPLKSAVQQGVMTIHAAKANIIKNSTIEWLQELLEGTGEMNKFLTATDERDRNAIKTLKDGKVEYWRVAPEIQGVFEAFSTASPPDVPALAELADFQRTVITHVPAFPLKNRIRDAFMAPILSAQRGESFVDGMKNGVSELLQILKPKMNDAEHARILGDMDLQGAFVGFENFKDEKAYEAKLKELVKARTVLKDENGKIYDPKDHKIIGSLKDFAKWYDDVFMRTSETAARTSEFKKRYEMALEQGASEAEASLYAQYYSTVLLDFKNKGNSKWLSALRNYVPFVASQLGALYSAGRAVKRNPESFAGRAIGVTLPMTLMALAATAAAGAGDEILEEPAYVRGMFWNFPLPDEVRKRTGIKYLSVPKPFDMAGATVIPETLGYYAMTGRADATDVIPQLALNFLPYGPSNLLGPITPILEVFTNRDLFRQRDIIPKYEEDVAVPLRRGRLRASSRLGRVMADSLSLVSDVDPRNIDHLVKGLGGSVGRMLTEASDFGSERSNMLGSLMGWTGFARRPALTSQKAVSEVMATAKLYGLTKDKKVKNYIKLASSKIDAIGDPVRFDAITKQLYDESKEMLEYIEAKGAEKLENFQAERSSSRGRKSWWGRKSGRGRRKWGKF